MQTNKKHLEQMKTYTNGLLEKVNRYTPVEGDPPLLYVRFYDHIRFFGWELGRVVDRLQQGAFLDRLGWKLYEDDVWVLLWEGGQLRTSRAILKTCIIQQKRLDTPEFIQSLRWVLAGWLVLLGPKFDGLLPA